MLKCFFAAPVTYHRTVGTGTHGNGMVITGTYRYLGWYLHKIMRVKRRYFLSPIHLEVPYEQKRWVDWMLIYVNIVETGGR